MALISQRELRNDSGSIMRRVAAGESFVVTSNGLPVAELTPLRSTRPGPATFVPASDVEAALSDLPDWGVAAHRLEQAALDAALDDDDRDPWQV